MSDNQEHILCIYSAAHDAGSDIILRPEDSRATINAKARAPFGVAPDSHVRFTNTAGHDLLTHYSSLSTVVLAHVIFELKENDRHRLKSDREIQVGFILENWDIKDVGEAIPPELWPRTLLSNGTRAHQEHNVDFLQPSSWSQQVILALAQLSRTSPWHPEQGWRAIREAVRRRHAREGKYHTSTNIDTAAVEAMPVDLRLAVEIIEGERRAGLERRAAERSLEMETVGERLGEVEREIEKEEQAGGGFSEPFQLMLPMRPRK